MTLAKLRWQAAHASRVPRYGPSQKWPGERPSARPGYHAGVARSHGCVGGLWYNPPNLQRYGPIIPDNPNWHRSKGWCPFYRERWAIGQEPDGQGGRLLYQIICLQNTPPETEPEQFECMKTRSTCWRNQPPRKSSRKKAATTTA